MCGIAGFIHCDARREADRDTLVRMTSVLAHRGPDGEGYFVRGPVALGHRRLAIIDPDGGRQPMSDPSATYTLIYNGELYNFRELRDELEAAGDIFTTASDTEVLRRALIRWGTTALPRLNGMFAFALWNAATRTLLCARDRAGQKPLYWSVFDGTILFASEPKALFQYPGLAPVLDRAGLQDYLANDYVAAPYTIYRGIFRLPAGHSVEWRPFDDAIPKIVDDPHVIPAKRYWQVPEAGPGAVTKAHVEQLRSLLDDAVVRHQIADVPVGVFLSGGIDSSAIAALLRRRGFPVATFTIGFSDSSFDESVHAARIAAHCGTDHHVRIFSEGDFLDVVERLSGLTDEPFGDASLLPTHLLSLFAQERVKVALGGDGADELWAGYPTCRAHHWLHYYRGLPRAFRQGLIEPWIRRLPVSLKNFSFDFKAKRFIEGARFPFPVNHQVWLGSFSLEEQHDLLAADDWLLAEWAQVYRAAFGGSWRSLPPSLRRVLLLDFHLYLADDILYKVDRASMSTSLEVRAPFLDTQLMDFVWRLPDHVKQRGTTGKRLLRHALRGILPRKTLARPKKGFGIPTGYWFRGPLRSSLFETLAVLKQTGLFQASSLDKLAQDHIAGRFDHRKKLWNLYALGRWWSAWNPQVR